jgi:enoyl-CoA hydratase/carnithine racemase
MRAMRAEKFSGYEGLKLVDLQRRRSVLDEGEQVLVHLILACGAHAVRGALVDFRLCVLDDPDAELDGFVDALARRIASFDGRAIAAAKRLINQVSLPSADNLLSALNSFQTALTWPETLRRVEALLKRGLQQDRNFERQWPAMLDSLVEK